MMEGLTINSRIGFLARKGTLESLCFDSPLKQDCGNTYNFRKENVYTLC